MPQSASPKHRIPSPQTNHRLHLISHTHWDREWYLSFETFRLRLVDVIDGLLALLDSDPEFRFFHLDGQTIVLEDYLAIRPHQRERLGGHIRDGRILIGPWYLQNDEFLTSGEATVRNLLIGRTHCHQLFGVDPMPVGYVPDQFGNISQLPQILRGFGIESAVFGRGHAGPDGAAEFAWASPDGSAVFAVLLHQWYNNAQRLPRDPDRATAMCREIIGVQTGRARTPHLLLMNGVDHLAPQENLSAIIHDVNARQPGFQLVHSSLPLYVDTVRALVASPPTHTGELREGDDGAVLPGTASSRVHLKQENFALQNELEAWVEPYSVLVRLEGGRHESRDAIEYAWKLLIRNHPHDSICGCSIDEVHRQMEARFSRVRDVLADQLRRRFRHLTGGVRDPLPGRHSTLAVFNPLPRRRSDVLTTTIDLLEDESMTDFRVVDAAGTPVAWQPGAERTIILRVLNPKRLPKLLRVRRTEVSLAVPDVPAVGGKALFLVPADKRTPGPRHARPRRLKGAAIREAGLALRNEHLEAVFNANGSVDVRCAETGVRFDGLHVFEDVADAGNEYIHMRPANDPALTTRHLDAEAELLEDGPLRSRVRVVWKWRLPQEVDDATAGRTRRTLPYRIESVFTLRKGQRHLEVDTTLHNTTRDHRLRVLFPTGLSTDAGFADAPFDIVRRPADMGTPNRGNQHPMQTFCAARDGRAGLAVFSAGMPEYELVGRDVTLALTLLRCVDLLGDLPPEHWHRDQLVEDYVPEAQCLRAYTFRYAVHPFGPDTPLAEVRAEAAAFVNPMRLFQMPADTARWAGERPYAPPFFDYFEDEASLLPAIPQTSGPEFGLLEIDNPRVHLSAVKFPERIPGDTSWAREVVVRVVNHSDDTEDCAIRFGPPLRDAARAMLHEEPVGPVPVVDNTIRLTLPPHRIETLRLRFA